MGPPDQRGLSLKLVKSSGLETGSLSGPFRSVETSLITLRALESPPSTVASSVGASRTESMFWNIALIEETIRRIEKVFEEVFEIYDDYTTRNHLIIKESRYNFKIDFPVKFVKDQKQSLIWYSDHANITQNRLYLKCLLTSSTSL